MEYTSPVASYLINADIDFGHNSGDQDEHRRNDYSRKSYKALRKRARRKSAQHNPGPGIGGRRNKRIA